MTRSLSSKGPGPQPASLTASLMAGALLVLGPTAQAQTLLDVTGASAIQGTLNNTATPQYGSTLQQVKASLGQSQSQGSLDMGPGGFGAWVSPPGGAAAGSGPTGGASAGSAQARASAAVAGESASAGPGTYVNGRYVAVCSHGGLCLGQLVQALRRP